MWGLLGQLDADLAAYSGGGMGEFQGQWKGAGLWFCPS